MEAPQIRELLRISKVDRVGVMLANLLKQMPHEPLPSQSNHWHEHPLDEPIEQIKDWNGTPEA